MYSTQIPLCTIIDLDHNALNASNILTSCATCANSAPASSSYSSSGRLLVVHFPLSVTRHKQQTKTVSVAAHPICHDRVNLSAYSHIPLWLWPKKDPKILCSIIIGTINMHVLYKRAHGCEKEHFGCRLPNLTIPFYASANDRMAIAWCEPARINGHGPSPVHCVC